MRRVKTKRAEWRAHRVKGKRAERGAHRAKRGERSELV